MKCPDCGAADQAAGRRCSGCGRELPEYAVSFQTCVSCHTQFDRALKKCPDCGADNDFDIRAEEPLASIEMGPPWLTWQTVDHKMYGDRVESSADYGATGTRMTVRRSRSLWRAVNIALITLGFAVFFVEIYVSEATGSLLPALLGAMFLIPTCMILGVFLWLEVSARAEMSKSRRGP